MVAGVREIRLIKTPFVFARAPRVIFGPGMFKDAASIAAGFGRRVLVVTGSGSLKNSGRWDELCAQLDAKGLEFEHFVFSEEPSPEAVDEAVARHRGPGHGGRIVDVVLAVGGGSVVDGGKAISAMLPSGDPTMDYLEGVGTRTHDGRKTPFIAVPTTAGTGSEATKNAVLSRIGRYLEPGLAGGFKKSLRHDNFVPDIAIVDPELTLSCPPDISAACGMDAVVQLLESFVSVKASPFTDALCESALPPAGRALAASCKDGAGDIEVRAAMSYASLVSGITLANAGLGLVHGFASAIGGFCRAPHGVICGTLVGAATRAVVTSLRRTGQRGRPGRTDALAKYARAGALVTGHSGPEEMLVDALVETLDAWVETLNLPRLGRYGVVPGDVEKLAAATSNKEAPIKLSVEEIAAALRERI
jgi:alcohol dehydrogenase class IV